MMFGGKPSTKGAKVMTALQMHEGVLRGKTFRLVHLPDSPRERVRPYAGEWPAIGRTWISDADRDYSHGKHVVAVVGEASPYALRLDMNARVQVLEGK